MSLGELMLQHRARNYISGPLCSILGPTLAALGMAVVLLLCAQKPAFAQVLRHVADLASAPVASGRVTACDPGFGEANLGQFPSFCTFGAATCMPKAPATACGGEGQRACCISERLAACEKGCTPAMMISPSTFHSRQRRCDLRRRRDRRLDRASFHGLLHQRFSGPIGNRTRVGRLRPTRADCCAATTTCTCTCWATWHMEAKTRGLACAERR